jgi:shikimate kinase
MLRMHVFLVGMSGGGKTSLGRKAAANLNLRFIDTDQRVTEMLGLSVNEIYATFGEELFRNAESGVLIELAGEPPCIISTGGGLPTIRENVQLMQNHGVIIHIDRPLDQILSDIKMDRRPTLKDGSHEDVILEYKRHIGFYHACADYTLDNSYGYAVGVAKLTEMIQNLG